MNLGSVYEALFREGERRPVDGWDQADGLVTLAGDGHLLIAKPDRFEDVWAEVSSTITKVAHQIRPGAGESYVMRVWDLEPPLRKFILASLVTDSRVYRLDEPLETSRFGTVGILYSNAGWDEEHVREEGRSALARVDGGRSPSVDVGPGAILSLDRRRPGI